MKRIAERLGKRLERKDIRGLVVTMEDGSLRLRGRVGSFEDWLEAGYIAASFPCREVINDLDIGNCREAGGEAREDERTSGTTDSTLEGRHFDVLVIGGGVIGCAAARELTRWNISVALVEKECDLAMHASGRNDGMVHPGFAAHPGTRKAYYNIRGNRMYENVAEELGLGFLRCGSMILLRSPLYALLVPYFFSRARRNGVEGCRFLSRRRVFRLEPRVTRKQWGAFYFPTTAVMSPHMTTIAYAENAVENGAHVFLDTHVQGMNVIRGERGRERIASIRTNRGVCTASVVINAAGVWSDRIAEYAGDRFFSLHFRKGVDCILDKKTGALQRIATGMPDLFQLRLKTKGGGVVPTCEGNLLIGPTANEVPCREEYSTRSEDIEELKSRIFLNRGLGTGDIITYFAGVRACTWKEDFIVEPSNRVENLVHAAGIQSPGFASAPAIAEDLAAFAVKALKREREVTVNANFNPRRHVSPNPGGMDPKERSRCIRDNPAYGRIICRCEGISEGEVRDALRSPVPATTVDGIKKRTRSGMGRCHGGFCTPRVLEIISEELGIPLEELTKRGGGSVFVTGKTKGDVIYGKREGFDI